MRLRKPINKLSFC
jgi:hypothetical protein